MGKGIGQASKRKEKTGEEQAPSSSKGNGCVEEGRKRSIGKRKIASDDNVAPPDGHCEAAPSKGGGKGPSKSKYVASPPTRKSQRASGIIGNLSRPSILDHDEVILDVANDGLLPNPEMRCEKWEATIHAIIDFQRDSWLSEAEREEWDSALFKIISLRSLANERRRMGREDIQVRVADYSGSNVTKADKSVQTLNEVESVGTQVTFSDIAERDVEAEVVISNSSSLASGPNCCCVTRDGENQNGNCPAEDGSIESIGRSVAASPDTSHVTRNNDIGDSLSHLSLPSSPPVNSEADEDVHGNVREDVELVEDFEGNMTEDPSSIPIISEFDDPMECSSSTQLQKEKCSGRDEIAIAGAAMQTKVVTEGNPGNSQDCSQIPSTVEEVDVDSFPKVEAIIKYEDDSCRTPPINECDNTIPPNRERKESCAVPTPVSACPSSNSERGGGATKDGENQMKPAKDDLNKSIGMNAVESLKKEDPRDDIHSGYYGIPIYQKLEPLPRFHRQPGQIGATRRYPIGYKYKCNWKDGCSYETPYQGTLARHFQVCHSDERPFVCPHSNCDSTFKMDQSLTRHLKEVHKSKFPYVCWCQKRFSTAKLRETHQC